jgi:acetolactate synthase I/II/III large subunit
MAATRMTGGEALAAQLAREGVSTVFGVPGIQLDYAMDGLAQRRDAIRYVGTRHEQGAGYLAFGYAQAGESPGVSMVVPGPGLLNAAAALSTAYACSSRVVCISGQLPSTAIGQGLGLLHEIPRQSDLLASLTKWSAMARTPAEIPGLVREAFAQVRSGRPRPAGLEIPPDVLQATADVTVLDPAPAAPAEPDTDAIEQAARVLASAGRPVILAGGGVTAAGAGQALTRLAEALDAPVVTSRNGRGAISDRHPLALTQLGGRQVLPHADVVLAVGTRFITLQGKPVVTRPGTRVILVNADPDDLGGPRKPDVAVMGDARLALEALADALPERQGSSGRAAEVADARAWCAGQLRALAPQVSWLGAIRDALPDDGVFVDELTQVGYASRLYYPVYAPRTYITPGYQGTLGYGFPAGLGAKVARPDVPVVAISGDGGFGWSLQELSTARKYGIGLITVVFADGYFGNVRRIQQEDFGRTIGTGLANPDFIGLARAFGVAAIRVSSPARLTGVIREAGAGREPLLIEVPVGELPSPRELMAEPSYSLSVALPPSREVVLMTSNSAQHHASPVDTPVVIVGAGPVGMFLALDLASKGIRSTVIERSTSPRSYPKGDTHNARTMEHYRRIGLARAIRAAGLPPEHSTDIVYLTRLNGYELKRFRMPTGAEKMAQVAAHSATSQVPEPLHRSNQVHVEKVVFEHLLRAEAVTCRLGTEFLGFEETPDGVTVRVRPVEGGAEEAISCRYLVGCDGGRSLVRRQLGLTYEGEEQETGFSSGLHPSKYLRIPNLVKQVIREPAWQYWLVRPGKIASLITFDPPEEFRMTVYAGDADDDDALRAIVDDFVGEHVDIEILDSQGWVNGLALVAGRYTSGRVLICGDAAHLSTPIGGFGMNTGIDDAANLAWKLAAAIQGWAGPHLLDSYEAERRPAGLRNTQAAIALGRPLQGIPLSDALEEDTSAGREAREAAARVLETQRECYSSLGVQLGVRYEGSPVIWPDGTPAPEDVYDRYVPTARPGARAPHLWLSQTQSLFDVLGPGFTLLRLAGHAPSAAPLVEAARLRGIPLNVVDIELPEARGLYESDLALIRPDQHVAWRGDELPDAGELLTRVTGGIPASGPATRF